MGWFNKLYILFSQYFQCIFINLNTFQRGHANDARSMCGVEQDQPPFYYSSKSELFTGDKLQLQLYKTSASTRVIDLHLTSVQEVKKTDVLLNFVDLSWKQTEI